VTLSVVIITFNEETNLPRTLESVKWADEIVVVDSHSIDRTVEIARSFGAKIFIEDWKGFAAQKNSAIAKATCDWVLSLDADEVVPSELREEILKATSNTESDAAGGYWMPRMNYILGRWMRHGGYWPDHKLRLFRRGRGHLPERAVHETIEVAGRLGFLREPLFHEPYPTLATYIEHMDRYSTLGATMAAEKPGSFGVMDIVIRPFFTFVYNYIFRRGFLDGREGLLLHLYHSVYVSWKYAKAWELRKK
jgi:glycosyltransferase involved in cell wall biosynthesis